jgi:hypothetical protein
MNQFTKLAAYLDSFDKDDANYDLACFLKAKIAEDLQDTSTVNNGENENLEDNEITMATPEQQTQDNYEGDVMSEAFKELDVLNKLDEEKEEIKVPEKKTDNSPDLADATYFGNNMQNTKQAVSLFDLLRNKIKK